MANRLSLSPTGKEAEKRRNEMRNITGEGREHGFFFFFPPGGAHAFFLPQTGRKKEERHGIGKKKGRNFLVVAPNAGRRCGKREGGGEKGRTWPWAEIEKKKKRKRGKERVHLPQSKRGRPKGNTEGSAKKKETNEGASTLFPHEEKEKRKILSGRGEEGCPPSFLGKVLLLPGVRGGKKKGSSRR